MTSTDARQDNMAVASRYIDAINGWDFETMRELLAEDAVFEMPFAPDGFERKFVGRENILAFVATVPPRATTRRIGS